MYILNSYLNAAGGWLRAQDYCIGGTSLRIHLKEQLLSDLLLSGLQPFKDLLKGPAETRVFFCL